MKNHGATPSAGSALRSSSGSPSLSKASSLFKPTTTASSQEATTTAVTTPKPTATVTPSLVPPGDGAVVVAVGVHAATQSGVGSGSASAAEDVVAVMKLPAPARIDNEEELREQLRTNALDAINHRLPAAILQLHKLSTTDPRLSMTVAEFDRVLASRHPDFFAALQQPSTAVKPTEECDEGTLAGSKRKREEQKKVSSDCVLPQPPEIIQMHTLLKELLLGVVELMQAIKLWVRLNVPRIEDGNNFGVGIQEETIAEVKRAEDHAWGAGDSFLDYHLIRAKMVTKCAKSPGTVEFRRVLLEHDRKEWTNIRFLITETRNNCAVVQDMIVKNMEKIQAPRQSSHMESLF
ncbi:proteasome activator complex subunit 3 [Pelomyxa schiedti]|nr:proteasome activator complex subunit 3 [Pelomyxa schiedti]